MMTGLIALLWIVAKLVTGLILILGWIWFVQRRVYPSIEARGVTRATKAIAVVLIVVSAVFVWACSWELSTREVEAIAPAEIERSVPPTREVRPASAETLQQKSERLRAEAEKARQETKSRYEAIEPRDKP